MAEGIWSRTIKLRSKDVNMFKQLRTSRLLELFQEASISHTEELGWPRQTTLDCGFLWMIAMQRIEIERMPVYDETIVLTSWPGPMMHVLYPRQYRIEDERGNVLVRGSAIWTLVDMGTRAMANPDDHGVVIGGVEAGDELPLPRPIRAEECDREASFTVPFSFCDLNGHMNNTRYLDVAEDHLAHAAEGADLAGFSVQYMSEIRFGDEVALCWREGIDSAFVEGARDGQRCFCISLEYR